MKCAEIETKQEVIFDDLVDQHKFLAVDIHVRIISAGIFIPLEFSLDRSPKNKYQFLKNII